MCPTPQLFAHVMDQRAYIGPFGASDFKHNIRQIPIDHRQLINLNRTRRSGDYFPAARQLIERSPFLLDGGIHGRDLFDLSLERLQGTVDPCQRHIPRVHLQDNGAFRIIGVRRHAQPRGGTVALRPHHQILTEPGSPPHTNDQHPRRQWVQSPGMAHSTLA